MINLNKNTAKFLFVIRGIPGSGKSTVAKVLAAEKVSRGIDDSYPVFEADSFFMKDGEYKFNAGQLFLAHNKCKKDVETEMKKRTKKIFVSNTSTQEREFSPYVTMAKTHGYMVFSMIVENRHNGVSEHNIPNESIKKMTDRFEVKL